MHIGQVIRSLREEKGWSQEKLAFDAGMTTSHVSRVERGERRLPTSRLEALAAALGTSVTTVYAMVEGLPIPKIDADLIETGALDHTPEAAELRNIFRKLSPPSQRLLVDFAIFLSKRLAG